MKKVHESKRIYQILWEFFTSSTLTMRKSAKEQQSQVQTTQKKVISRNVIRDNGIINNFWKSSCWFCRQCLRTFCYFSRPESSKWLFGKLHLCPSIWTQTSPNWTSLLHSLHALSAAVLAIPANSAARANHTMSANHIVDCLYHVFFLTCTNLH